MRVLSPEQLLIVHFVEHGPIETIVQVKPIDPVFLNHLQSFIYQQIPGFFLAIVKGSGVFVTD